MRQGLQTFCASLIVKYRQCGEQGHRSDRLSRIPLSHQDLGQGLVVLKESSEQLPWEQGLHMHILGVQKLPGLGDAAGSGFGTLVVGLWELELG